MLVLSGHARAVDCPATKIHTGGPFSKPSPHIVCNPEKLPGPYFQVTNLVLVLVLPISLALQSQNHAVSKTPTTAPTPSPTAPTASQRMAGPTQPPSPRPRMEPISS